MQNDKASQYVHLVPMKYQIPEDIRFSKKKVYRLSVLEIWMMKLCMHFKHSKDRLLKVLKLFRCPKWKGFGDLSFSRIHNLLNIDRRFQISDTVTDKLFFFENQISSWI